MPSELERRLERLLQASTPSDEAERHALASALGALPASGARATRPLRMALLLAAALAALSAVAAGSLAAAGALHVTLGEPGPPPRPAVAVPPRLTVPPGANGIAAVIDGRLWLTTRSGLRIEGLAVDSATLSPRALYVAAGVARSLVAMAPDGTRAWSHPARGRVVAVSWSPNGLRIAYVVRRDGRFELRTIEGNGSRDRLLDRAVRPVDPSWRADSLAVAYVGAGGRPVVYDFSRDRHRVLGTGRNVRRVAFAPAGGDLAASARHAVWISAGGRLHHVEIEAASIADACWSGGRLALAYRTAARSSVDIFAVAGGRAIVPVRVPPGTRPRALACSDGQLVLAVTAPGEPTRLVASAAGDAAARARVLLRLPPGTDVDALAVR